MNGTIIKIIGIAATAIGLGATLLTNWVDDKKLDTKILETVTEVMKAKFPEE